MMAREPRTVQPTPWRLSTRLHRRSPSADTVRGGARARTYQAHPAGPCSNMPVHLRLSLVQWSSTRIGFDDESSAMSPQR